ncbi:hypothetical protein [Winogradskyella alexanderae]|uniref:Uncharacterized protein n=1 Tax=Winogradskyella alexanderae TaxID=2877123 RepID=A0ABS7XV93_9FLAO|nr:hypothetical protein [Winogradskyella alexanderae]MCA0133952.1 hypothetical protein [Winogradskyella alexanderae]
MFWKTKYKLESKKVFQSKIEKYYLNLADNKIPKENVTELSEYITNLIYEYYQDCWKKYPKSRKRYSELKIEDLENPFYQHRIFDFLKSKTDNNYVGFTRQLLGLNESEFLEFEKRKNEFENM